MLWKPDTRIRTARDIERSITHPDIQRDIDEMRANRYHYHDGQVYQENRRMRGRRGSWLSGGPPTDLIYKNTTVGTAKASFTTEFQINDTAGMGAIAWIPAGYYSQGADGVGKTVGIIARGVAGVTATPTWIWTFRWNPTFAPANPPTGPIIGINAAATALSGVTAQLWECRLDTQCTIIGAAGNNSTLRGLGHIYAPGLITPASTCNLFGGGASPGTVATFDNTLANTLTVGSTSSASSASNTIQLLQLLVVGWN